MLLGLVMHAGCLAEAVLNALPARIIAALRLSTLSCHPPRYVNVVFVNASPDNRAPHSACLAPRPW